MLARLWAILATLLTSAAIFAPQGVSNSLGTHLTSAERYVSGASVYSAPAAQGLAAVAAYNQPAALAGAPQAISTTTSPTEIKKTVVYEYVPATNTPAVIVRGTVTEAELSQKLGALAATLESEIASARGQAQTSSYPSGIMQALALTNAAAGDSNGATLNNVTVNHVTGLAASDIPSLASIYLPLAGGSVTGNLSVSGSLTSGSIAISTASTTGILATNATTTNATTTSLEVSGSASTSNLIASNSFTLASLTGFLKATAGAVATSLINLASDVTGVLPVANGGTGASSFGQGWLYSSGATSTLSASTSPTVNYLTATSTTATSTFAGGLSVAGASGLTVLQNGNVGIGTVAPTRTLSVAGSITTTDRAVFSQLARTIQLNSAGSNYGTLQTDAANEWSLGYSPTDSATVGTPVLAWNSSGNVGIGTTTPQNLLHLSSSAPALELSPSTYGGQYSSFFGSYSNAQSTLQLGNNGVNYIVAGNTAAGGALELVVNNTSAFPSAPNGTAAMYITSTGNVGVGTVSPGAKLGVNGGVGIGGAGYSDTAQTTGDLAMSGNLAVGVTSGQAKATVAGSINSNSAQTDTVFSGTIGRANANFIGTNGYWALRTATNNSYNLDVYNSASPITALTVLQNGNVGIGTTSPYAALSVAGASGVVANQFAATSTTATSTFAGGLSVAGTSGLTVLQNGNVGVGGTAPSATPQLYVLGPNSASASVLDLDVPAGVRYTTLGVRNGGSLKTQIYWDNTLSQDVFQSNGASIFQTGGTSETMRLTSGGNVGIGTTSPYARLTVWGPDSGATTTAFSVVNNASTTAFAVYDNGNATYSGSIFQSSDERLKSDIQSLDASSSLAAIVALNPVSYTRLDQPAQGVNLGFIAQQLQKVLPELVSTSSPTALTPDGTLTLNYLGLLAPIVKAIQELAAEIRGFAQSITTAVLNATTVNTDRLCISDSAGTTCITRSQVAAMLAGQSSSAATSGQGNGAFSCTLSASPSQVASGDRAVLSWSAPGTDTFSIDQGIGAVSPAASGTTTTKAIAAYATFTGTATSPTGVVATCSASVSVLQAGSAVASSTPATNASSTHLANQATSTPTASNMTLDSSTTTILSGTPQASTSAATSTASG
jgi:hypothetical protein